MEVGKTQKKVSQKFSPSPENVKSFAPFTLYLPFDATPRKKVFDENQARHIQSSSQVFFRARLDQSVSEGWNDVLRDRN